MRSLRTAICLAAVFAIAAVSWAEAQRRGGRGGPSELTGEQILDDFDNIVEMIWTEEEEDAWGDLDSDEEKQAFVVAFWESRDPTPGTPENEFRDIYMGRVNGTLAAFRGEGIEAYRTDRGRVFIIYGNRAIAGQERRQGGGEMGAGARTGASEDVTGAAGRVGPSQVFTIVWKMDTTINAFLEDKEEITFAPFQGAYEMSTRGVELSQEAFLANRDVQEYFEARRANPAVAMGAAGAGAEVPPEAIAMQELLQGGIERSELALQQDFSFFPAPEGNTYTVFAFEVGKSELTFEAARARVKAFGLVMQAADDTVVHGIEGTIDINALETIDGDSVTHTFSVTLIPGEYRMAWGVMDMASGKITTVVRTVSVPSLVGSEMMLTSVAMAKSPMRRTGEPIDTNKIYRLTRIGGLELDADVDRVFGRTDTIALLYFVIGVQVDPSTGQSQLEVGHRVLRAEDDQSIARLPSETLQFSAIAQNIPLAQISQLEAGKDYKIEIHVKDLATGKELTAEVPFSVAPEGSRP